MADWPVVTIIGGGVWVAALVEQLLVAIKEQALEIRLVARDPDRLGIIADYCRRISINRANWRILTQTLDAALDGADICVLLLRVGGSAARQLDENFPRRFGLAGDEGLGAGGYANALRTLPTMSTIARKLAAASPDVIAVNLVAPLGMTTRVLLEQGLNAVGLCELPITTERALRKTFPAGSIYASTELHWPQPSWLVLVAWRGFAIVRASGGGPVGRRRRPSPFRRSSTSLLLQAIQSRSGTRLGNC